MFVGNSNEIGVLIAELAKFNPHYRVLGYVAVNEVPSTRTDLKNIAVDDLENFVYENYVSEIVVTNTKNKQTSLDLYNKLLRLLEGYCYQKI